MSEGESRFRTAAITYFPMFIATLSLITSIYNGYLNNKFVDLIQRNFGRAEYSKGIAAPHVPCLYEHPMNI